MVIQSHPFSITSIVDGPYKWATYYWMDSSFIKWQGLIYLRKGTNLLGDMRVFPFESHAGSAAYIDGEVSKKPIVTPLDASSGK